MEMHAGCFDVPMLRGVPDIGSDTVTDADQVETFTPAMYIVHVIVSLYPCRGPSLHDPYFITGDLVVMQGEPENYV